MKHFSAVVVVVTLLTAACGGAGIDDAAAGTTTLPTIISTTKAAPATTVTAPEAGRTATVIALALRQLATVDTTFGQGHRFTELLVQTHLDPAAGSAIGGGPTTRPLSEAERSAIETELRDIGPMRWIEEANEWMTDDLAPVVEGSAIVGVGEPVFDDDGALVPVSMWCGGVCGTWFTYRLVIDAGEWVVVGPEGPIAVS